MGYWLKVNRYNASVALAAALVIGSAIGNQAVAASGEAAPTGDPVKGESLSKTCEACHGAQGNSAAPNFPKLAGQVDKYTFKQLMDMKSGARPVPEMTAFVANMSEQDMRDLGAYYAAQTTTLSPVPADLFEQGKALYSAGDREAGIPACAACHGAQGKGVQSAGFPALSGQHAMYTAAQLKAYRAAGRDDESGKRRENDGDTKIMRTIAGKMSDEQIKAVSAYVSGLH